MRPIQKTASSAIQKIFSWGSNNFGRGCEISLGPGFSMPRQITAANNTPVLKAVAGYGCTLFITKAGQIQLSGNQKIWTDIFDKPDIPSNLRHFGDQVKLIDGDIDKSHCVLLSEEGRVFELKEGNKINEVELPSKARLICSGNKVSFAVIDREGVDEVFYWGCAKGSAGAVFATDYPIEQKEPTSFKALNNLIKENNSKIKKMSVVDQSAVVLLENGKIFVWGDNTKANLGVPRSELVLNENLIHSLSSPLPLASINDQAIDFSLSDNILILKGVKGLYWCGLDNRFSLSPINLPRNEKAERIGSSHNHFYVISDSGRIYSNLPLEEELDHKFYGKENLYELDRRYLYNNVTESIFGKYHNAFAITN